MRSFLLATLLFAAGCAPGLGTKLTVNSIAVPDKVAIREVGGARVLPFRDEREQEPIARIDGRDVLPDGDISNSVRAALEGHLRSEGVVPRAFDVPSVSGSIEKWFVDVKPGFPVTDMQAVASVRIEVTDATGRPTFRKRYSGESMAKEVVAGEDKVAEILGDAMAVALSQASKDQNLIDKIVGLSKG